MPDIKADSDNAALHERITGRGDVDTLGRTAFLAGTGKLYEVRTVISPPLFGDNDDTAYNNAAGLVEKVCRTLKAAGGNCQYKLIRYRPVGVRPPAAALLAVPGDTLMSSLAAVCTACGIRSVVV
jgi:pyruvate formate lyase activating enzyme